MTAVLIEKINGLSDTDSVTFLEYFNQSLFNGVANDSDELLANIPASIHELPHFNNIEDLFLEKTERQLTEKESIELAKPILKILVQTPYLLPLLEQTWEAWNPNGTLGGDTPKNILSAALAASMLVVVASSEVKGNIGGVEIHKPPVPLEQVTALFGQFGKIILGSK